MESSWRSCSCPGPGPILFLAPAPEARAFCGFYVGKADASLYNEASQVVLVRDVKRTVIGMMNDFKGDPKEFALVVPVPVVLEEGQIHVGRKELFDRIDAYSAPRLVEYFDEDPCRRSVTGDADGLAQPLAGLLLIYALTRNGRVETTNYRTVKLPTGMDLPEYVKGRFPDFYRAMFARQVEREEGRAVFTEYVWNLTRCDPCSAPPLTPEELRGLGVFWEPAQAMITRLHVRYAAPVVAGPVEMIARRPIRQTGRPANFSAQRTRPVICITTNRVTMEPMAIDSPVNPLKKKA